MVRRNTVYRHFQELHVEAIVVDSVFERLVRYVQKFPDTACMLSTPYEPWIKMRIQAEHMFHYAELLAERYLKLAKATGNIGLHVHLFHPLSVEVPGFNEQYVRLVRCTQWLMGLGLPCDDFAPGWNGFNADTVQVCANLGFKQFHIPAHFRLPQHDGIGFVRVWNAGHDWGL